MALHDTVHCYVMMSISPSASSASCIVLQNC